MLDLLTADDVLSHVMMLADTNELLYLLVEGDTDCSVIDPHIDIAVCDTIPSGGKTVVLGAIRMAREEGFSRLAAVVDLDWVGILYPKVEDNEVFFTDHYDIDATVFFREQNTLRVAGSFSNRAQLRSYVANSNFPTLHEAVKQIALPVGLLRFTSEKHRLQLNMRDFPISVILDHDANEIDVDRLIDIAIKRSGKDDDCKEEIARLYREEGEQMKNPVRYLSGHDLLTALAAVLHKKCGSKASIDAMSRAVRGAYGCSDARESPLFSSISKWGASQRREILTCL
ncbi:DUF4435 domain-containing protein [Streptomyces sp. MW-W600-10]|uniref:DUF4435 domain-containing protein n=1 Tax=Streptomyces sp. MW-W600-10 TaxID=2829819 RepID=UPI001C43D22C|nr:DUF4435 domain-containing protein [Streptomyces sp. MW-W600-10]MBV7245683.1 hypothetical protein [Streptomyces sp. MW-W600-10]